MLHLGIDVQGHTDLEAALQTHGAGHRLAGKQKGARIELLRNATHHTDAVLRHVNVGNGLTVSDDAHKLITPADDRRHGSGQDTLHRRHNIADTRRVHLTVGEGGRGCLYTRIIVHAAFGWSPLGLTHLLFLCVSDKWNNKKS